MMNIIEFQKDIVKPVDILSQTGIKKKAAMMQALAQQCRIDVFDVLHSKGTGHWGGAASAAELLTVLYFHMMRVRPEQPDWPDRDRLVLSKGHASCMLYSVMAKRGYFPIEELKMFRDLIHKPNGIILVTGPTGCGKTTTLYSALQDINTPELKIITTEDPVEYDIEGIMQVEINEEIGVTFATCLRAIVRQDPDVILVGEIRDLETAEMAIDASLTGHLVFSTLHTNDAPTTVTRLIELDVQPFLISATLEAVVGQRLVRRICPNCKTEFEPTDAMLYELGLRREDIGENKFFYGRGCMNCNHTGYRGRTAIFEVLLLSEHIRQMIIDGASTGALRDEACKEGMLTLRERGQRLIFEGVTTIEEIVRETLQTT